MKWGAALLLGLLAASGALARPVGDEPDLLYLDAKGWDRLSGPQKRAASAAFMRVFCTDRRMEARALAICIDGGREGEMFERALSCSARLAQ